MKKYLLIAGLVLSAGMLNAQTFELLDKNGTVVNGGNVSESGGHMDSDIAAHVYVKNTSGTTLDVKVKRYELNVGTGTKNYFCWFSCYGAMDAAVNPLFPVPGSVEDGPIHKRTIASGVIDSTLSAHHEPHGVNGTSCYLYVVYDANNPNDSASVEVCFNVGFTSIDENAKINANHYPNPATDQLNIELDGLNGATAQLEVYNMVGKVVDRKSISSSRTVLNTSAYGSGVYFYSVKNNNAVLVTRKFVVR